MSDPDVPRFWVSNEGDPIPPVDPENLKRHWKIRPGDTEALIAERIREVDSSAILHRDRMIRILAEGCNHGQLLAPWKHGEDLDDAVFRLAATFPMRPLRQHTYKVPGDSRDGFDPNAFVEKFIEETGISHTWEPVRLIHESGLHYMTFLLGGPRDPEAAKGDMLVLTAHEAKLRARELLWAVWSKCQPNLSRTSGRHEDDVASVAWYFADFAIDNIALARELVSTMHGGEGRPPLTILLQMERNASWLHRECSVCQRLMCEHSDEEMAHCSQALPPGTMPYRWRTS